MVRPTDYRLRRNTTLHCHVMSLRGADRNLDFDNFTCLYVSRIVCRMILFSLYFVLVPSLCFLICLSNSLSVSQSLCLSLSVSPCLSVSISISPSHTNIHAHTRFLSLSLSLSLCISHTHTLSLSFSLSFLTREELKDKTTLELNLKGVFDIIFIILR